VGTSADGHPCIIVALEAELTYGSLFFTYWTGPSHRAFNRKESDGRIFHHVCICHDADSVSQRACGKLNLVVFYALAHQYFGHFAFLAIFPTHDSPGTLCLTTVPFCS
jgi:hypothetical protein